METKSISKSIYFDAEPNVIYSLFIDKNKQAELTGSAVEMSNEINGHFSIFDGYCQGYNIEIIENKKIVQAWHFAEDG